MDILSIYFVVSAIAVLTTILNTYVTNTQGRNIVPRISLGEMVSVILFCFIPLFNIAIIYLTLEGILIVKTFDFGRIYPFEKK